MEKVIVKQDKNQFESLLHKLILDRKGECHTGLSLMQQTMKFYGLKIDHHEFCVYLDYLASIEAITRDGFAKNGMHQYYIGR